jgi:hypothetical protein
MMDLMEFIKWFEGMKGTMRPIKEEIFDKVDQEYLGKILPE